MVKSANLKNVKTGYHINQLQFCILQHFMQHRNHLKHQQLQT